MAYQNSPVKIPKAPGKITFRKMTDKTYVLYETGRVYNSAKKSNTPQRTMIGLQIRNAPTLMLPNENYDKYFSRDGEEKMTAKERTAAENYEMTRNDFWMLNCMFEQLYYEFQIQAHRDPHLVVNAFKIQRINKVLEPLKRMMEGKAYAAFLEIPPEPREVEEEGLVGLDYSDVVLLLTQYKGAMTRFAGDCL